MTTNGSIASSFADLILSPNCCCRTAAISLGVTVSPCQHVTRSRLRRLSLFLGLDGELVGLLRRADLVRQLHPPGPGRDRQVERLRLGLVMHRPGLVVDAPRPFA